ncbi:MAG: hypothetical protein Q4G58_04115 [bacterium]|nr:hypothetical protein [bacterium]
MFRKHYENANNNFVPSQSLINDTKQKMYDRLSDIEFSNATDDIEHISDASKSEVIRINSELKPTQRRSVSHTLKIACSIAACAAIVTSTAFVGKSFLKRPTTYPEASFMATASPSPSFQLDDILGTYYTSYTYNDLPSYTTITLSDPSDKGVHFVYTSVNGDKTEKEEGNATLTKQNTLVYDDADGCGFALSFENTCLYLSSHASTGDHFNQCGQFMNIDGKNENNRATAFYGACYFVSDKIYKFDINNDGKNETLKYSNGILTINEKQVNTGVYSENLRTDGFYLVDLDKSDNDINLLIQDDGPSSDPVTSIFTYRENGTIEDQIGCKAQNVYSINQDGKITGTMKFNLLQNWYGHCTWDYKDGHIQLEEHDLYAGMDPRLYSDITHSPYLKKNIKLYSDRSLSSKAFTMKPQTVEFTVTDNKNWVKVVGLKDKTEGWLYLEDFNIIPSTKETAEDYFDQLT